jgi:hypothetical protein
MLRRLRSKESLVSSPKGPNMRGDFRDIGVWPWLSMVNAYVLEPYRTAGVGVSSE